MKTATLDPPAIKERPILFSGSMVRAILEGKKTQTRRVLKLKEPVFLEGLKSFYKDGGGNWVGWTDDSPSHAEFTKNAYPNGEGINCPYGKPGDRLWVRETWRPALSGTHECFAYRADMKYRCGKDAPEPVMNGWKSSIHMPRKVSRLLLEVTEIRVQRLQDISEEDAIAEGIQRFDDGLDAYALASGREVHEYFYGTQKLARSCMEKTAKEAVRRLWDVINASKHPWINNPWVWVVSFKPVEA